MKSQFLLLTALSSLLPLTPAANAYDIGLFGPNGKTIRLSSSFGKVVVEECRAYADIAKDEDCEAQSSRKISRKTFLFAVARAAKLERALPTILKSEFQDAANYARHPDVPKLWPVFEAARAREAYLLKYEPSNSVELQKARSEGSRLADLLLPAFVGQDALKKIDRAALAYAQSIWDAVTAGGTTVKSSDLNATLDGQDVKDYAVLKSALSMVELNGDLRLLFSSIADLNFVPVTEKDESSREYPLRANLGENCQVWQNEKAGTYLLVKNYAGELRGQYFAVDGTQADGKAYVFKNASGRNEYWVSSDMKFKMSDKNVDVIIRSAVSQGLCK